MSFFKSHEHNTKSHLPSVAKDTESLSIATDSHPEEPSVITNEDVNLALRYVPKESESLSIATDSNSGEPSVTTNEDVNLGLLSVIRCNRSLSERIKA